MSGNVTHAARGRRDCRGIGGVAEAAQQTSSGATRPQAAGSSRAWRRRCRIWSGSSAATPARVNEHLGAGGAPAPPRSCCSSKPPSTDHSMRWVLRPQAAREAAPELRRVVPARDPPSESGTHCPRQSTRRGADRQPRDAECGAVIRLEPPLTRWSGVPPGRPPTSAQTTPRQPSLRRRCTRLPIRASIRWACSSMPGRQASAGGDQGGRRSWLAYLDQQWRSHQEPGCRSGAMILSPEVRCLTAPLNQATAAMVERNLDARQWRATDSSRAATRGFSHDGAGLAAAIGVDWRPSWRACRSGVARCRPSPESFRPTASAGWSARVRPWPTATCRRPSHDHSIPVASRTSWRARRGRQWDHPADRAIIGSFTTAQGAVRGVVTETEKLAGPVAKDTSPCGRRHPVRGASGSS